MTIYKDINAALQQPAFISPFYLKRTALNWSVINATVYRLAVIRLVWASKQWKLSAAQS